MGGSQMCSAGNSGRRSSIRRETETYMHKRYGTTGQIVVSERLFVVETGGALQLASKKYCQLGTQLSDCS
jgi:hypothetical protein